MKMAQVEVRHAFKSYGSLNIMRDVSVTAEDGEFLVLVGPSGCGKTTLLRIIAGLEDISAGEVLIDRETVNDRAPRDRDIAMVFQGYALYPRMTVRQNLSFGLKLRGTPKPEIERRVMEAANMLGLSQYLGRMPKQLSGGQRQRVAMGRAIVRDPKVFLFDEPLSNLDAKLRVQMRAELKKLHTRLGATSIYVTHDQIEAMTMADRIVVMRDGIVEQSGRPLDIFDNPASVFVAGFIGSPGMNFIPGQLKHDGSVAVDIGKGRLIPVADRFSGVDGQSVLLGVRPEHFSLSQPGDGVPVTVDIVEPTGSENFIGGFFGEIPITVVIKERLAVKPGSEIWAKPHAEALHLFDAETSRSLYRKV
jgi:multiple sugar transport system ATP-binding protein